MPRATTWSDLKIGIIALLGVLLLAAGVLKFARIGALHGDTTTIYVVADGAAGAIRGTEVWLAGRKVGLVRDVQLRPIGTDTSERVLIQLDILSPYLAQIRKNSTARVQSGTSLIAEPVVAITAGTSNMPVVKAGDTLHALSQLARRPASVDIASLGDSLVAVGSAVQQLFTAARTTAMGPIEHLRARTAAQAAAVQRAINVFSARTSPQGHGSANLIARDTTLRRAVGHVKAELDSIVFLMNSRQSSIGRFRRDSTLEGAERHLLATTEQLRTKVTSALDSHLHHDTTLVRQLDAVQRQLDSLITDVKRHPLRYNPF